MENQNKYTPKLQPRQVIKCPYCKAEYLTGENLYPDNVIGQPDEVIKDPLGKILYESYREDCEPLLEETFWCEKCDRQFVVEVEVKCKVKQQKEELDFSDLTVSLF